MEQTMYGESEYLLRGLSDETRKKILELGCEISYGPGECIFHENEAAANFYILNQGRIRLSAGRRLLLAHVASSVGDVIGWSSLATRRSTSTPNSPNFAKAQPCRMPS